MLPDEKIVPLIQDHTIAEEVPPYNYAPPAQSPATNQGFIRLPRSLFDSEAWKECTPIEQGVYLKIVEKCWYKDEPYIMDDHGSPIQIFRGQCCYTFRKLQEFLGKHYSLNDIQRAIGKLKMRQLLIQEVIQRKSVFTICHLDTYNMIGKQSDTRSDTGSDTERKNSKNIKRGKVSPISKTSQSGTATADPLAPQCSDYDRMRGLGFSVQDCSRIPYELLELERFPLSERLIALEIGLQRGDVSTDSKAEFLRQYSAQKNMLCVIMDDTKHEMEE